MSYWGNNEPPPTPVTPLEKALMLGLVIAGVIFLCMRVRL